MNRTKGFVNLNRFKSGRIVKPFKKEVKNGTGRLGMSILPKFSYVLAGNIFSCGVGNGVEGSSPVEGGQKCSPCLVHNAVHI